MVQMAAYETLLRHSWKPSQTAMTLHFYVGLLLQRAANTCLIHVISHITTSESTLSRSSKLGRKTAVSIDSLLKERGFSEKAIEEIFKYYGQSKKEK
jgi:hypothetical protein